MAIENTFSPNYAVHPGEYLGELLEYSRMEQVELAVRLNITPKHVSNMVNGKVAVTAKTALALEYVFPDRPARYWLGLQDAYDLFEARRDLLDFGNERANSKKWLESFDMDVLERAGYLPVLGSQEGMQEHTSSLLKFFGCSSIEAWNRIYGTVALRKTGGHWDERGSLLLAWLRKGQVDASERVQSLPRFDRRAFGRSLPRIKRLSQRSDGTVVRDMQRQCAEVGVMLSIQDPLPDMDAASAAFWLRNTPCVQVSKGLQTNDELWLDFAREAAYVLKGKTYEVSLNGEEWRLAPVESVEEWLIPWSHCLAFASKEDFSIRAVRDFAVEEGVHPGIVVGMLQRAKLVAEKSPLNELKSRIEYGIVEL
ncbi:MAG: HigA family addiction module antitoxin [Gordonibacter sp.]|uniref:HigA family addiction module antitoxin n=1 Tax=Gordonibacter sp. TaxID=1968902 RepID=UPI002FC6FB6D